MMAHTSSLAWPNMFDVATNKVVVKEDEASVVNRTKLLMLTEPTEVYNETEQGVGLKRHLWKYNTENEMAIIQDRIINQLREYEPSVVADRTNFAKGLKFTEPNNDVKVAQEYNKLKMTVSLEMVFGGTADINLSDFIETDEVMK